MRTIDKLIGIEGAYLTAYNAAQSVVDCSEAVAYFAESQLYREISTADRQGIRWVANPRSRALIDVEEDIQDNTRRSIMKLAASAMHVKAAGMAAIMGRKR